MMAFPKVIKFPTKTRRRTYRKKLLSWYTAHEIFNVTVGVLCAQVITLLFDYLWSNVF